jgi:hypothetical protein
VADRLPGRVSGSKELAISARPLDISTVAQHLPCFLSIPSSSFLLSTQCLALLGSIFLPFFSLVTCPTLFAFSSIERSVYRKPVFCTLSFRSHKPAQDLKASPCHLHHLSSTPPPTPLCSPIPLSSNPWANPNTKSRWRVRNILVPLSLFCLENSLQFKLHETALLHMMLQSRTKAKSTQATLEG